MKFGIAIFPTDYAISMTELAPALEQRGFESLFVAEHTHIPSNRRTLRPGDKEMSDLPEHYWHTLNPFIALTAAAVVTKTLRIGTGICLVIEHDPIDLAKQVASVDHVSGGRFIFGVGGGWNREEMANHGTAFESRWKLLRERIEAMKAIWTHERAEYHSEFVSFDPILAWPKPVQKPYPPIYLGGNGRNTLSRVVRYADGWMPNRGDFLARIPELRRLAQEAGRGEIPVSAYGRPVPADIERFIEAGVARAIYYLPSDDRDAALFGLETLTRVTEPYRQD
jgi:probable F420-dependent oxidoreductase